MIRRARNPHIGVTGDDVSKWERGVKGISGRNRALLAGVFGVTIDQLGFPDLARGDGHRAQEGSLVSIVDQAAELLDQLGAAGHAVRPQMLAAVTDEVMSRRAMLAVLDQRPPTSQPPSVDDLDTLVDSYEAVARTAAPAPVMTALTAHLRTVTDALGRDVSAGTRQRLLRNRARCGVLAGQVAEKLGHPHAARGHYAQALDDAYELNDLPVAALVHGHFARLAVGEGSTGAALRHLDSAFRLDITDAVLTAWLEEIGVAAHGASDAGRTASEFAGRPTTDPPPAARLFASSAAAKVPDHRSRGALSDDRRRTA